MKKIERVENCGETKGMPLTVKGRRVSKDYLIENGIIEDWEAAPAQPKSVNLKIEKIKKHRADFSDLDEFEPCEAKEMNDIISRQAAINVADMADYTGLSVEDVKKVTDEVVKGLKALPSAQPTLYGYKIEHLAYIASVMKKEGVTAEYAVRTFDDMGRVIKMTIDETRAVTRDIVERSIFNGLNNQTGGKNDGK